MNKITQFAFLVLAMALTSVGAFGQTAQCSTTLASAITSSSNVQVSLTSAACLSTLPAQSLNQYLYVDNELLYVRLQAAAPTTALSTTRGASGTHASIHASGATVYIGPGAAFSQDDTAHVGGCVATSLLYLPLLVISPLSSHQGIYDCRSNGAATPVYQWIRLANGTNNSLPEPAFTSWCSGTVGSAETEFIRQAVCSGTTTSTWRFVVPTTGYISNFRAFSTAAFVGTGGSLFTVLKNGVATLLTCAPVAAATTCSNQTIAIPVAAGDTITFSFLSATSDTAANLSVSLGLY